jgi:hypothetical protein
MATDDPRGMTEFQVNKYFDAIKQVGTANSAGLFGGVVALYYFKNKGDLVLHYIKLATGAFLVGVIVFAVSFWAFMVFVHWYQPTIDAKARPALMISRYAAVWAVFAFLIGSGWAAYILYLL